MGHDAEQDGDLQGEASSKASRWLLPKGSSFRHAVRGIRIYFLEHTHARFHLVAALCVMGIALGLGIDRTRCAVLLLAIGQSTEQL